METFIFDQQRGSAPAREGGDGLYSASGGGAVRGYNRGGVRQTSLYTQAQTRPGTSGTVAGLLVGVSAGLLAWRVLKTRTGVVTADSVVGVTPLMKLTKAPMKAGALKSG